MKAYFLVGEGFDPPVCERRAPVAAGAARVSGVPLLVYPKTWKRMKQFISYISHASASKGITTSLLFKGEFGASFSCPAVSHRAFHQVEQRFPALLSTVRRIARLMTSSRVRRMAIPA